MDFTRHSSKKSIVESEVLIFLLSNSSLRVVSLVNSICHVTVDHFEWLISAVQNTNDECSTILFEHLKIVLKLNSYLSWVLKYKASHETVQCFDLSYSFISLVELGFDILIHDFFDLNLHFLNFFVMFSFSSCSFFQLFLFSRFSCCLFCVDCVLIEFFNRLKFFEVCIIATGTLTTNLWLLWFSAETSHLK